MVRMTKKIFAFILFSSLMFPGMGLKAQDLESAFKMTRAERFLDASAAFKQLIQKNPNNGDIYFYYGENYLQEYFADTLNTTFAEMADSATRLFQKGIQADPSNPLGFVGLGQVSLIRKKMDEAKGYYAKAIALLPSKANKSIVMAPEKQAVVYIKMAAGYIRANVNDTAMVFAYLRNAEKLDKNNYDLYITRGDAYIFLLNDGSKAISNYNMAQNLNPKSPLAKLRVGQLWMRARNYDYALKYYQEVVQVDSSFAPAYRELGYLLSRAGRNDEAQQNYKKYLILSSNNVQARIQYVNTLMELRDYAKAIEELNTIMKSDSSNNDLNRALAYSYFETKQYDKGLLYSQKFFKHAKQEKIRPTDYAYLGRLLAKTKQDSLAHLTLLKAFELDTAKPELISEAAMSLIRLKKYENAIDVYNMKIAIGKATPNDFYNLGKVYYNVKNWKMADTTLATFNKLMPEYLQGYVWRARTLVNIDSTTKLLGLAKPVYEIMIEKAKEDSLKNGKELMEAYSYLSYYYFLQFKETKDQQAGIKSVEYCNKVLAIEPQDPNYSEKAKAILKDIEPKIRK